MKQPRRILGLVSGKTYDALAEEQRKTERRAGKLAQLLEETKADSREWKEKAAQASAALKTSQEAAAVAERQSRLAEKLREEAEKHRRSEQDRTAELAVLQQRLIDSERDLAVAREQLMAIEVKLDILEGAANVLDGRTRDIVMRRSGAGTESGTAV
jgi:chromosome segregation ATPase